VIADSSKARHDTIVGPERMSRLAEAQVGDDDRGHRESLGFPVHSKWVTHRLPL
jgi:hypothetical protein